MPTSELAVAMAAVCLPPPSPIELWFVVLPDGTTGQSVTMGEVSMRAETPAAIDDITAITVVLISKVVSMCIIGNLLLSKELVNNVLIITITP